MKARIPSGFAVIFFETDLSKAKGFDESELTDYERSVYNQLGQVEREKIQKGYAAVVHDLSGRCPDCEFNIEGYVPPKSAIENLARHLLPSIQAYYADEKHRTDFCVQESYEESVEGAASNKDEY